MVSSRTLALYTDQPQVVKVIVSRYFGTTKNISMHFKLTPYSHIGGIRRSVFILNITAKSIASIKFRENKEYFSS